MCQCLASASLCIVFVYILVRMLSDRSTKVLIFFFPPFSLKKESPIFCFPFIRSEKTYPTSVTRLSDLLDFGQLFKAFGNKKLVQIFHILWQFL